MNTPTTERHLQTMQLPGVGTVSGFCGSKRSETSRFTFSFTNAITPSATYTYDPGMKEVGQIELIPRKAPWTLIPANLSKVSKCFYTSKDGTKIPMTLSYKKGLLKRNGKNPTILYGYGGFNISLTPSFSTSYTVWMEQGGVLAIPNIRGGGEYGEVWHVAGTQLQKKERVRRL